MKPFNLELAKAGHPVQTREGNSVRILCYDREGEQYPIVALVKQDKPKACELIVPYTIDGKYEYGSIHDYSKDLVMATSKKEGWVNIYKNNVGTICSQVFGSESDAEAVTPTYSKFLLTKRIEWEE